MWMTWDGPFALVSGADGLQVVQCYRRQCRHARKGKAHVSSEAEKRGTGKQKHLWTGPANGKRSTKAEGTRAKLGLGLERPGWPHHLLRGIALHCRQAVWEVRCFGKLNITTGPGKDISEHMCDSVLTYLEFCPGTSQEQSGCFFLFTREIACVSRYASSSLLEQ